MDNTKKDMNKDNRPLYVSPQVMRLDNVHSGRGQVNCQSAGSGYAGICGTPGNSPAGGNCAPSGHNAAAGACAKPGLSPK
jgi:hypothetical protein